MKRKVTNKKITKIAFRIVLLNTKFDDLTKQLKFILTWNL